ncbi:HpcH/HpaI aldolase/citrate lyase family protein [Desulfitobacterium sp. AusDCA]|uniref:HpcH/HpaI aldolase/citrate lyase family protein n=1 Tax=Desulfitobacterium sp. AusDCA TaxID=3240383 RepID=UPI003DA74558
MKTRVFMFSPGSDRKKNEKALESAADVVILDLEDAVAPSEKEQARLNVAAAVRTHQNRQVIVRINALSTPWALKDLLMVIPERPFGIMLPKAESVSDILKASWVIDQLESDRLTEDEQRIGLFPLIETVAGIANAEIIAQASIRVKRLVFGALDYSLDLGIPYDRNSEALTYARNRLVAASAQSKLPGPIDTVYPSVKDDEGLKQDSLKAKALGFKGKLIIHPGQIEIVQTVFSPLAAEIEEAEEIVEVYQKAQSEGVGAVLWKGKMLDEPVLKRAQQILKEYKD